MPVRVLFEPRYEEVMTGCGFAGRLVCNRAFGSSECTKARAKGKCPGSTDGQEITCATYRFINEDGRYSLAENGSVLQFDSPN
jgi:hypothetical protein